MIGSLAHYVISTLDKMAAPNLCGPLTMIQEHFLDIMLILKYGKSIRAPLKKDLFSPFTFEIKSKTQC